MRYPPRGGRSFGDNLSVNLGLDYPAGANDEVFLAVQIETAQGLANVDAIMAVEGVDGCWLGPADLALSLGVKQGAPEHTDAIRRVLQACRRAGKIPGMFAGTTDIARRWMDEGYQFVTVSCDLSVLEGATQEILSKLHAVSG
jgi:4-hydroxy-2-oxoheptanedioate aldolase